MLACIERFMGRLVTWGGVVGAIAMAVVVIIVVMGVLGRVFSYTFPGTFDLVESIMIVTCAYSFAYCQKRDRHAKADVVLTHLHRRARAWFEAFTTLLSIGVWAVLMWAGMKMLVSKWERGEQTEILKISIVPFRALWVVSLILMVIILGIKFLTKVKEGVSK